MQVQAQIDRLIANLEALKASLSQPAASGPNTFSQQLESAMGDIEKISIAAVGGENAYSPDLAVEVIEQDGVPSWFDPNNPKRPSTMQLMEIMTGQEPSEIFEREDFKKLSRDASDMRYGVIGSINDKRDWEGILTSGSIISTLRAENAKLLAPSVSIESTFARSGEPMKSTVTVRDGAGNKLRVMHGEQDGLAAALQNMGVTAESIVADLKGMEWSDMSSATRNQLIDFIS